MADAVPDTTGGAGTTYIVLALEGEGDSERWMEIDQVLARSPEAAIREAWQGIPGKFVAIPARSWKPVTVESETVTRLKFK